MADKKEEPEYFDIDEFIEVPLYIAKHRRNEVDGNVYNIGDTTTLDALTVAEIGYVVGRGYYSATNPETLSDELLAAIEKEMG